MESNERHIQNGSEDVRRRGLTVRTSLDACGAAMWRRRGVAQNAAETEQKPINLAIREVSLERCSTYQERLYEQTNVVELGRGTIPCHLTLHLVSTVLSTGVEPHLPYFPHIFLTFSSHFPHILPRFFPRSSPSDTVKSESKPGPLEFEG